MKEEILEIRSNIKAGRFVNEAAVSQGIVQRLLHALGWPVYNPEIVSPEYSLEGRRVDYALCHPPTKPLVLIEVKQVGQSDGADRQLFEYAFYKGVPMAILTDGQEWHFFLPGEQGDYGERRVYKLDILERDPDEIVARLQRYLNYKAVCSSEAIEAARKDYRDVAKKRQVKATLPEAWIKLIEAEDELLIELLADKVESLCGYKPDPDTVASFLTEMIQLKSSSGQSTNINVKPGIAQERKVTIKPSKPNDVIARPSPSIQNTLGSIGFVLHGREHHARNARDLMVKVLKELDKSDPRFLERFAALPQHGRSRRYVARKKEDLYPGRADLARDYSEELRSGWWIGINVSRQQVARIIEMACEVAGINYGTELRINLG